MSLSTKLIKRCKLKLMDQKHKNPLHGVTLEKLLTELVEHFGFPGLAELIDINCFKSNPSIKSSLTFLRRTPWARTKIENLYISYKNGLE